MIVPRLSVDPTAWSGDFHSFAWPDGLYYGCEVPHNNSFNLTDNKAIPYSQIYCFLSVDPLCSKYETAFSKYPGNSK